MRLQKLTLENFKGVRSATYEFDDRTRIKGKNGSGKTTIADAIYFLMVNKSFAMVDNPPVRPNDAIDEIVTSVTAELDMDGKPVEIQKSQKLKRSKSGTVALTNSYMVNSVPKSEKAFKEYMTELGLDFDKFLSCSHPGVLLAGINNKKERTALRNLLFEMASDITDEQVAANDPELEDVAKLLANYKADEIEAIQNATLRKIRENYGKEGEILRAKIDGMESSKVNIDKSYHEAEIQKISEAMVSVNTEIEKAEKGLEKAKDASAKIMQKKFDLVEVENKANHEKDGKHKQAENELYKVMLDRDRSREDIERCNKEIKSAKDEIESEEQIIQQNRKTMATYKLKVFDENTAICPTCGQKLKGKHLEQAKAEFESKIKNAVKRGEEANKEHRKNISKANADIGAYQEYLEKLNAKVAELDKQIKKLNKHINDAIDMPKADMATNAEYQHILSEIGVLKNEADKEHKFRQELDELLTKHKELVEQKDSHLMELSKESHNTWIDGQIAKLREDQRNYEQSKADAEKILDQLKTLNMKKNEMLQESVNKNFNLVDFVLFITLKNGEVRDACVPTINGKRFGESMNNALEVLAKIDVMDSIQRFYGLDYPIILDNAECLDSESMNQIKTNHQLIMLCVSDDEELVFEKGGEE